MHGAHNGLAVEVRRHNEGAGLGQTLTVAADKGHVLARIKQARLKVVA